MIRQIFGVAFVVAVGTGLMWLDPEAVGLYDTHKEALHTAYDCFQKDAAKLSQDEASSCEAAFKILGYGDAHNGILNAMGELKYGLRDLVKYCTQRHGTPNLTDADLKMCGPVWWPGMINP